VPTYSYKCKKCGHTFDLFHTMSAKPHVICEKCKGPCERMLGTGAGISFNGSGFYETDYKRGKAAGADKKSDSGPESKPAAKSEAKSDGASETKSAKKAAANE